MAIRIPHELSAASILDRTGDGFVAFDRDWRFTYVNARGAEIQGHSADLLIGRNLFEVYPDAVGTSFESAYRQAMTERVQVEFEAYFPPWDRWFNQRVFPTAQGIGVFFVDITERRRAAHLSAGQARVLEMIAKDAPLGDTLEALVRVIEAESPDLLSSILLLDEDGVHLRHGAAPSLPPEYLRAIDGEPIGPSAGSCGAAMQRGETVIAEDIETDPLWAEHRSVALKHGLRACWSTPIFDSRQRVLGSLALYFRKPARPTGRHNDLIEMAANTAAVAIAKTRDERERARVLEALHNRDAMSRSVFENAAIGMTLVDMDQRLIRSNPAFAHMLGYSVEELRDRRFADFSHPEDIEENLRLYRALAAGDIDHFQIDKRYLRKDGSVVWGRVTVSQAPQEGSTPSFTVGMIENITERKNAEARVEHLATHDGLTGLPNRNLLHERLTQAIAHARRTGKLLALLYVDLDRFKVVNDGFGHPFGDAVIKAVGERLAGLVRDTDTVARHSGDEFLVLLADLSKSTDAYIVTQKMVDAFEQPFAIEGRDIHLTASIGVSIHPQDGPTADALIGNADVAAYRAKVLGGNTYEFFTQEMSRDNLRRVELETKLRLAIAQNQLQLVYQPKVDLRTGRINGCEALLRWSHPELGVVSPIRFIPIAEDSGLIVPIGDWVLRTACAQNKAWIDAGLAPISVAVNISARQFLQQDVVAWVMKTLDETGLAPERLELELTESLMAQNVEKVIHTVNQLKSAGVKVSIDDFGTGYSNLGQLKRFRVDTLKIDQSFVKNMLTEPDDATIALAVISLAHSLRMRCIAEGVETAEHAQFLRLNGCDEIQGYHVGNPMPAAEFEVMLRSGKRVAGE